MAKEEAEAVFFYRLQLLLPQKFVAFRFRFHIPRQGYNVLPKTFIVIFVKNVIKRNKKKESLKFKFLNQIVLHTFWIHVR